MKHIALSKQSLTLSDGRQLSYAEYGAANGYPLLFFHGTPGSRLSIFAYMSQAAAERGLRIIAPDRPGYGTSDFIELHSALDYAADMQELLNTCNIQRCSLIGFSTGSIFALACALALSHNVDRLALAGAFAPMEMDGVLAGLSTSSAELFNLARNDKAAFVDTIHSFTTSSAVLFAAMAATLSQPDQQLLNKYSYEFTTDFDNTLATGTQGFITDLQLTAHPWDFSPADIKNHVDLWVGSEDSNAPPAMSRYLASVLPNSHLHEVQGEGHSCLYTCWEKILDNQSNL